MVRDELDECILSVRKAQWAKNVDSSAVLGVNDASFEGEMERIDLGTQTQSTARYPRGKHPNCRGAWHKHPLPADLVFRGASRYDSPTMKRLAQRRARKLQRR